MTIIQHIVRLIIVISEQLSLKTIFSYNNIFVWSINENKYKNHLIYSTHLCTQIAYTFRRVNCSMDFFVVIILVFIVIHFYHFYFIAC